MTRLTVAATGFLACCLAAPAVAQESSGMSGAETRFAAGVVWQQGVFGDDDPEARSSIGAIVGLQVRRRTTRTLGASFEIAVQPIGIRNPHFDESLHTIYALAGPEIGRRTYVRPTGGVALQIWSGSSAESGLGFALAAGVAVGRRAQAGHRSFNPEFVIRCSASPGAAAVIVGGQVAISSVR